MALTEGLDHDFLADVLSAESIQEQVNVGSITQDDADLALSLQSAESGGMLDSFVDSIGVLTEGLTGTIIEEIIPPVGGIPQLPFDLEDKIKGWLIQALEPILGVLNRVEGRVLAVLSSANDALFNTVEKFGLDIVTSVGNMVSLTLGLADELEEKILGPVIASLGAAQDLFLQIDDKVRDVVTTAIAPIKMVADELLDRVQGFATALREALPALGSQLGELLTEPLIQLDTGIGDMAKSLIANFFEGLAPDAVERIEPIIALFEEELSVAPELRKITSPGILPVAAVGGLIAGFALPMILASVGSTMLSPFAEKLRQRMNSLVRPALMNPNEVIDANRRGFAQDDLRDIILSRHGFPDDQKNALVELVKLRPGTFDIIDYWRRELLTDEQADTELHQLGWDSRYRDLLRDAAFPPPGVQDLIRMAVREVFSPEVAEAFGQFEEIPDQYLLWAKRVGLSDEWARNFWAAHWVLPSVQQGFQMLHRKVITSDDLEKLFVALDVMPFWRKNLKAISFRPFTRVDVRRMFALGILDRPAVVVAYTDLGFDDIKAEAMTEFTVRFVEGSRKVEKVRERDLTKGDILGLFNDGLLEAPQAKSQLMDMGFDSNEAELLVAREELQELTRDRKADIKAIVDQAKIKTLSFTEANDALNGLDLTRRELAKAVVEITRSTAERVRLPSKGDLDSWRNLELISLQQYETELDSLGFPQKYVALYVEESQLEAAEDLLAAEVRAAKAAEPRPITKGQLDTLLRTEIIDEDEYTAGLRVLRFADTAIDTFVTQINLQLEEARIEDAERIARGELAADKEKLLGRVILGKLVIKDIIGFGAYEQGLIKLGFATESVQLLIRLLRKKVESDAE